MRWLALTSLASLVAACGGATTSPLGGPSDASGQDVVVSAADAAVGDAPPAQVLDCVADAGVASTDPGDPSVQDTLTGTNGVFTDSCDSQGNLVDYSCETETVCGPGPTPGCSMYDTGRVVPQSIDCSGHCVNGRCDGRCPSIGQGYHFVAVGPPGAATLMNDSDGRTYACSLIYDQSGDSFDCTTGPTAGLAGSITSLGLHGGYCTGQDFGNIGVTIDGVPAPDGQSCTYSCSIP